MDPQIEKKPNKIPIKKVAIIFLIAFSVLMLAISGQFVYRTLSYNKVYEGVSVNGINVSGLTIEELKDFLMKNYQQKINGKELIVKSKNSSEMIPLNSLNVKYDIPGTASKAYNIGRNGNIFAKLYEIYITGKDGKKFDITVTYDKQKVEKSITSLYNKTLRYVKEADLLLQDNKAVIRSGHPGENIDKSSALKLVDASIRIGKIEPIEVSLVKIPQSRINVEDYYKQITRAVQDAKIKTNGKTYSVQPHVVGRSIDKSALSTIATELEKTQDTEKVLPVVFTKPKVTTEDLNKSLFKDTLGSMSTHFSTDTTNNANRGVNIRLAVSKINGTILAPGDLFSFNGIVGERTVEGGYKAAHAYIGGKVVDDVGGGICQVSTTLYNSVLFSDLHVSERHNHMFTVGYVPYGRDAAVSYGDVDFKFKNSLNWPIKVEGWVSSDNNIYFSIKGTNETPGKKIEINPHTLETINVPISYINNASLNEGVTQVKQSGGKGYIVDTYKIVKINGQVASETKLHTSYYKPLPRIIVRGTKKVAAAKPVVTTPKQNTSVPVSDVADTDGPPEIPAQ